MKWGSQGTTVLILLSGHLRIQWVHLLTGGSFFEETSKSLLQKAGHRQVHCGLPREKAERPQTGHHECESTEPWFQKRSLATSCGEILSDRKVEKASEKLNPPRRLGTFAEYQASWKEQKKPLEARSSGRYHSADDILDAGLDQQQRPQYIHERSRSSPSTDHYSQEVPVEPNRQAEDSGDHKEAILCTLQAEEGCSAPSSSVLSSAQPQDSQHVNEDNFPSTRNPALFQVSTPTDVSHGNFSLPFASVCPTEADR